MTKTEFQERVGKIAENLTAAMYAYNDGSIDIHTFKQIMRDEMADYPYDWFLATDDENEFNEELEVGELYHRDEIGESADDFKHFVKDFIEDAHNWDKSRFTTTGSNSFLFCLIGEEGINY